MECWDQNLKNFTSDGLSPVPVLERNRFRRWEWKVFQAVAPRSWNGGSALQGRINVKKTTEAIATNRKPSICGVTRFWVIVRRN
jgi:hypothetical protein